MDKTLLTDEELIIAFQRGDRDSFNCLVNRYKNKLTNFIYRFTSDIDSAVSMIKGTARSMGLVIEGSGEEVTVVKVSEEEAVSEQE